MVVLWSSEDETMGEGWSDNMLVHAVSQEDKLHVPEPQGVEDLIKEPTKWGR